MEVHVWDDFEKALRIFRKRVERNGILREFKARCDGYKKPGVKRRDKHRAHLRRIKKGMERRAY
jgi:small subunit ribosomal protein S21